jgi:hypothetical protein
MPPIPELETDSSRSHVPTPGEHWLTISGVARYLGISRSSVARLRRLIPHDGSRRGRGS